MKLSEQIEDFACAFYLAEGPEQSWDDESEFVKRQFRRLARDIIALMAELEAEATEAHELSSAA